MAGDFDEIMRGAKAELAKPDMVKRPRPPAPILSGGPKTAAAMKPRETKPASQMSPLASRLSQEQQLEGGRGQGVFRARNYSGSGNK